MNSDERKVYMRDYMRWYRKKKKLEKQWDDERREEMKKVRQEWNTSCQWLEMGYVVKDGSVPIIGSELQRNEEFWFSDNYYYYHISDCEHDEEKAQIISDTYPDGYDYDGRAWWLRG